MTEPTIRLTAAQALVRYLSVQHSERDGRRQRVIPRMFGIFGHGNVCGLGEALSSAADSLPFHQPKHEQAMVHTALGYAKATRRLSTFACTASIGPGATNLVTGAATATVNRLPVLLLPGDTFASRRQGPVLQQLQHPASAEWSVNETLRPVSRFFDRISRPTPPARRPRHSARPPVPSRWRCTRTCRARRSTARRASSSRARGPCAGRGRPARRSTQPWRCSAQPSGR